ncbi:hypothetical protein GCM10009557_73600 [Virgisporangium ochraceum]|uniref:Glyoxalase-like domain-containing protein n=1 Tax=Virgisporangium ochraceum TaxID=65505 RepID=A0A8J4EDK5_9ACTN|nr:VOC family protein [Virgisporangium ochraceum]GIJ70796.1 hypothetical protein Voc01_057130 [Virgisporangium ochraceum]
MNVERIRQAVVASHDRDAVVAAWRREFGLGAPHDDPGVAAFGLINGVVPVGDAFLEVVTPSREGTAVGRHLARHGGDCGYMVIAQVTDMAAVRAHLAGRGVRTVWSVDLDDISATHAHPADTGAALVSFDQPVPPSSWRWGGADWTDRSRTRLVTGLAGVRIAGPDPEALRDRWARVLDVVPDGRRLPLPDGSYVEVEAREKAGMTGVDLWAAAGQPARRVTIAGTEFRVVLR